MLEFDELILICSQGGGGMKQNKKRFWQSETLWEYVVTIIVSSLASIATALLLIKLGLL